MTLHMVPEKTGNEDETVLFLDSGDETLDLGKTIDDLLIRPLEELYQEPVKHIESVVELIGIHQDEPDFASDFRFELVHSRLQSKPMGVVDDQDHVGLALLIIQEQSAYKNEFHLTGGLYFLEHLVRDPHVRFEYQTSKLGEKRKIGSHLVHFHLAT